MSGRFREALHTLWNWHPQCIPKTTQTVYDVMQCLFDEILEK
jgi:hypothetical protein